MRKPLVAYFRVSTREQGRSGLGIDAQRRRRPFRRGRGLRDRRRACRDRDRERRGRARSPPATRRRTGRGPPQREGVPDRCRQARPSITRRTFHQRLDGAQDAVPGRRSRLRRRAVPAAPIRRPGREGARSDLSAHESRSSCRQGPWAGPRCTAGGGTRSPPPWHLSSPRLKPLGRSHSGKSPPP